MTVRKRVTPALISAVKDYLNITWDDEATDRKISGLTASGIAYIDLKYGSDADYNADGLPRQLLMEYVRYARDNALEAFENNYKNMLLAMRHERAVNSFALDNKSQKQ
jgi:hypothetical protein